MKISYTNNQGKYIDSNGRVAVKMNNTMEHTYTDFNKLVDHLKKHPKGFTFAQGYFKGGIRKAQNLESISLLCFDFDDATSQDYYHIQKNLLQNPIQSILFTTTSHSPEKPRFRVIYPLKSSIDATKILNPKNKTKPEYTRAYQLVGEMLGFYNEEIAKQKGYTCFYDAAYSKIPSQAASSGVLINTGQNKSNLEQDLWTFLDPQEHPHLLDFEEFLNQAKEQLEKEKSEKTTTKQSKVNLTNINKNPVGRPRNETKPAFGHILSMIENGQWWQGKEYLVANALDDDFTLTLEEALNLNFQFNDYEKNIAITKGLNLYNFNTDTGTFNLDPKDKEDLRKSDYVNKALLKAQSTKYFLEQRGLIGGIYYLSTHVLRIVTQKYGEKSVVDYSSKDDFIGLPDEFTNLIEPTPKGLQFKKQAKYLVNDKQIYRSAYVLLSPYYRGAVKSLAFPRKNKVYMDGNTLVFNEINNPKINWEEFFKGVESKEPLAFKNFITTSEIKKNMAVLIGRSIFDPYQEVKVYNRLVYCFSGGGGSGKSSLFNLPTLFIQRLKQDLNYYPFGTYMTQQETPNFEKNQFWSSSIIDKKFIEIGESTSHTLSKNINIIKEKTGINMVKIHQKYQDEILIQNDATYFITSNFSLETLKGYFFDEASNTLNRRFVLVEVQSDLETNRNILENIKTISEKDYKPYLKYFYDLHKEPLLSQMDDTLANHREQHE